MSAVSRWAAGRVASGPYDHVVHLVCRGGGQDGMWRTVCRADQADGGARRQVSPVLEMVGCRWCADADPRRVPAVNTWVAQRLGELSDAGGMVEAFLRWAAADDGMDGGGVVLAVYAGGTRLHPVRADEREKLIGRWLEVCWR